MQLNRAGGIERTAKISKQRRGLLLFAATLGGSVELPPAGLPPLPQGEERQGHE
jgi:hypothetical protein